MLHYKHFKKSTRYFLVPSSRFQNFEYILQDPKPQETEKIKAVVSFLNRNLKLHGPFRLSELQICCKFCFVTILFFYSAVKICFFALILKLKFYAVPVQWFWNPIVPWPIYFTFYLFKECRALRACSYFMSFGFRVVLDKIHCTFE